MESAKLSIRPSQACSDHKRATHRQGTYVAQPRLSVSPGPRNAPILLAHDIENGPAHLKRMHILVRSKSQLDSNARSASSTFLAAASSVAVASSRAFTAVA